MKRAALITILGAVVALAAPTLARAFGGWALITVDDLPERLIVQDTTELTFIVRAHGRAPMNQLRPTVVLASGKTASQVAAVRLEGPGRYGVRFIPPAEGDWSITVKSGYGPSDIVLHPIAAVRRFALASATVAPDLVDRGRKLFVAKGCVMCHVHADAGRPTLVAQAPELSHKRFDSVYLRMYLANPAIKPPTRTDGLMMPNLGLKDAEIDALVAFVNAETRGRRQEARDYY